MNGGAKIAAHYKISTAIYKIVLSLTSAGKKIKNKNVETAILPHRVYDSLKGVVLQDFYAIVVHLTIFMSAYNYFNSYVSI